MTDRDGSRVLVLVPTYNDFEFLPDIVSKICQISSDYTVLIVNDGSLRPFDPTAIPGRYLYFRLPDNVGLGVCTQIAFDHALRHGYERVARIDADGQHPVERLADLIAVLSAEEADIVVGTRRNHRQQGFVALLAAFIKGYYVFVGRLMTGGKTPTDMNTGFFALNSRAIWLLNDVEIERYPEPLLFIKACRYGLKVREVSIDQKKRQYGQSSMNLLQALRMFYRFNMAVLAELFQKRSPR